MPMPRRTTLNRETELATRTTTMGTEFHQEGNNENSVIGQQSVTPFSQTNTNTINNNNNDGNSGNNTSSNNNPKNRRKSSFLGYFFGESDAEKTQLDEAERKKRNNDIIPRINGKRVLDAEVDVIPSGTRKFPVLIFYSLHCDDFLVFVSFISRNPCIKCRRRNLRLQQETDFSRVSSLSPHSFIQIFISLFSHLFFFLFRFLLFIQSFFQIRVVIGRSQQVFLRSSFSCQVSRC
jgi:hypothetical protein